jgi:nitrite reductase (cytochrome c-552)
LAVVGDIQDRHHTLLNRAGDAVVAEIKATVRAREAGATDEELKPVWLMQRKAQWRYDYVAAENSMGFHAPQESARILAESIDYARQGECKAFALVQRITPERRKAREKPPQLVPHPVEP